ncbi:glycosyltransferase family 2 protein [Nocardioides jiangxiensis]|uniref:Glycosyltransferase family 2 protein n=1 Tax=Nocardioides jiangxiensis TaxID=3064524 RepID=A0ABT9B3U0_9ACTN|nr:glycosyltransferase family 2 protein [Nocardioides sp. WY-20]MDO7869440.1 glycosyltransferase family 2 protein [Nocardioides sp. WY-20]
MHFTDDPQRAIVTTAMAVLVATYAYYWFMAVRAIRGKHIDRTPISDADLVAGLAVAAGAGSTREFLIQVTTKGGALSVVERGIDNVMEAVRRFPTLATLVRVEVVTESPDEIDSLHDRYADSPVPVTGFLLPPTYATPRGSLMKARALHYMVEVHRAAPRDCYVVHYDEESVFTPDNLARLVRQLLTHPVGISEGSISYGLDWEDASLLNRAMESNRPFGCHECYSVMTNPPPMHLHGSNLVIRQDLENRIGWDIGTLDGVALIAEDLVFGLASYLEFGPEVFGWHYAEMVEQPPFTVKDAFRQRERWIFGTLQGLAHLRREERWKRLPALRRSQIVTVVWGRIITYALGFPVTAFALYTNTLMAAAALGHLVDGERVAAPTWTPTATLMTVGLVLWTTAIQLGLWHNLRYTGLGRWARVREHVLVLVASPFAGIADTAGPLVALVRWLCGARSVTWTPTPKLAGAAGEPARSTADV